MTKNKKISVQGIEISFYQEHQNEYISLTDIARHRDSERSDYILQNWMRSGSTIEFIGLWEQFNNPDLIPSNSMELKMLQDRIAFH